MHSTVGERRRITKVVGGVRLRNLNINALCDMDLLGEDGGSEYRFDAMS